MTVARLVIAGDRVPYEAMELARSLEDACGVLSVQTHANVHAAIDGDVRVTLGGKTAFAGVLERTPGTPRSGWSLSVRSATAQLEKYDATGAESFRRTTMRAIVQTLAQRVQVGVGAIPALRVNHFRLERGRNLRDALQELADAKQLVLTDDEYGRIVFFGLEAIPAPDTTWTEGIAPLTEEVRLGTDYTRFRREWVCRGTRVLAQSDGVDVDNQIGFGTVVASTRPSRRVLPNRAASSRAEAAGLLQWRAKQELGRAVPFTVILGEPPGELGRVVRLRVPRLGVDEVVLVSAIRADFAARRWEATCVFPVVYQRRTRLPAALATRARTFTGGNP